MFLITVTSPNNWKLVDLMGRSHDTISYSLPVTSWEISAEDLVKDGGATITFGATVEDFSSKRPGAYYDDVKFDVEVQ